MHSHFLVSLKKQEKLVAFATLLENIADSASGPQTCALFDFDGTIISGYSAIAFIKDQLSKGDISPTDLIHLTQAATRFGLGQVY